MIVLTNQAVLTAYNAIKAGEKESTAAEPLEALTGNMVNAPPCFFNVLKLTIYKK